MSSNAARIFEQYYNGDYAHSGDQIRLRDDDILSQGTIIGRIESLEVGEDYYEQFLILSLQNFKSQKNWKTHKKQLAKAANKAGLPVIIVPELDIGFGLDERQVDYIVPISFDDIIAKQLIEVAKYSQDEDIKTAACAILPGYCMKQDKVLAYSYNQYIDGEFRHAEDILCSYISCINEYEDSITYYSLLEPCYDCLKLLINACAENIKFAACHKDKWNTIPYIQYTNDIMNKDIKSNSGRPIIYEKVSNKYVNKFYKLEEK